MNYFFHPQARTEHLEHVIFYESRQRGLGARYLAAFDTAMTHVCAAPHRYKIEFPPYIRRYQVPGFLYNILYRQSGRMLRYWLLPRIAAVRITGLAGFSL